MTTPSVAPSPGTVTGPFAALLAQAQRAPRSEALRILRRGQWRAWSWQRLAVHAELAARGWAALGVRPGARIVALGPLGADLIITLFAADALGATAVLADDAVQAQVVGEAHFAFADGTHELERLLRHRGTSLRAAVVGDPAVVPASGQVEGVPLYSTACLVDAGRSHSALPPRAGLGAVVQIAGHDGVFRTPGTSQAPGFEPGQDDRVFADFAPTWPTGLGFILHTWPARAPLLLIPEPHGDAAADQRDARANLWLASPTRLAATAVALRARVPARGLGARIAQAVLDGGRPLLGALARSRMRAGMGLAATRFTISDASLAAPTEQMLRALGIVPAALAAPTRVSRHPSAGAIAQGGTFGSTLAPTP